MSVPTFASSPLGFTLTMRMDMLNGSSLREMGLNERQILAVERAKVEGSITSSAYQVLTGVSAATALKGSQGPGRPWYPGAGESVEEENSICPARESTVK